MELIFWRHAEAEDERDGLPDVDRALTERGERQASRVGAWLRRHLPENTLVLCSPALRCQQTALRLGWNFAISEELAQGRSASDVLEAAQWPDANRPVMLVGHQPALGEALARLLRLQGGNCAIRKGAVWWLRTRERDGAGQTIVWAVQSPETA